MESHSLVLLSGSVLDHSHIHNTTATRRAQPLSLPGQRRPLRNLAQGLARLLPQLRQFSQRLRWTPALAKADARCVQTCPPASDANVDSHSSSGTACCTTVSQVHVRQPRIARWRTRRAQRARPHQAQLQRTQREQHRQEEQALEQRPGEGEQAGHPPAHGKTVHLRRGPLRRLRCALRFVGNQLRPVGPGDNDKNMPERILNVATCGMFFQAGSTIVRLCRSMAARRFGWAFIAVGAVATVYHGSWGRFRNLARKVDYYAIAASSLVLRSAVLGAVPRWLSAAMVAAVPFKPTLVTTSNFMAVEVRYLLLALSQRHLLAEWAAHTGLSVAATAFFSLEESPLLSWFPYTHAAFHTLSAAAFLTLPSALNHITSSGQQTFAVAAA